MRTGMIALAGFGLFWAAPLLAADFSVSNVGASAYDINGTQNPSLTLTRGVTYTFSIAASGHPFFIKTQRITGTGSAFNTGVTNNGIDSGTLTFTVPPAAPNTIFYNCEFHSSMGGTINVQDPSAAAPSSWAAVKSLYQ